MWGQVVGAGDSWAGRVAELGRKPVGPRRAADFFFSFPISNFLFFSPLDSKFKFKFLWQSCTHF
jgi:hypothetical protein